MKTEYLDRIRREQLRRRAGDVKLVPSALARRMPFQVEQVRTRQLKPVDVAVVEAVAITATGARCCAYVDEAKQRGGQTPHVLEKAFAWHQRYRDTGSMLEP